MSAPIPYLPPASDLEPLSEVDPEIDVGADSPYGPAGVPARELTPEEVKGIVQREIADALGGLGSQVSEQQRTSIRMYYGRPMGNEIKDRSQVISRDVLEVIEWTMPSLMRMFTGGTQSVRFLPPNEKGQKNSDLATSYVNHLWKNEMDGFSFLHDYIKTGLMEKNAVGRVYFEEKRRPVVESFEGLTEDELLVLLEREGAEPIASEERVISLPGQNGEETELTVYDVTLRFWKVEKQVKVDGIPPEEFLVSRRMIHLNDNSPFIAQRKKMTVSELVELGFPFETVATLPSDETPEYSQGRTERLSEDETFPVSTADRTDSASREIWVTDCIIKLDEDGDGYAELRRILVIGEQSMVVLEDEEISYQPFFSYTPVPMPHKFFGQSLSDLVMDLQVIRSTLLRMMLDHIYVSVNPRNAIVENMVEVEDMLTIRPGGLVRQRAPGSIEPILVPPLPREAFDMYKHLEEVRANRTGIMAHGRELDASAINSTATGLAQLMAEKQQKIELIARILANSLKQMFKLILRCVVENDTKESQIRHNGEWVTINPSEWDAEMDLEVEVALGAGQAVERIANMDKISARQQAHVDGGGLGFTVTPQNIHEADVRLAEACGFKNPELFFTNPEGKEPPKPPPDPALLKVEADAKKAEGEQKLKGAEFELAVQREKNLVAHRAEDIAYKERVENKRIEMEERVRLGQQEATLEAAQITADSHESGEETQEATP